MIAPAPLPVAVQRSTLQLGDLSVTFHRTLRIPDDGREYPLPPSLGHFPLHRVDDFADRVPASWRAHGGVFLPMFQREAMWLGFAPRLYWSPTALKVAVGMVNAVSGKPWRQKLDGGGQDYLVCPPQPWLDGINAGDGTIKQFVAMPLGMGYTVEGQVTGEERFGGIQLVAIAPKPGRFHEPREADRRLRRSASFAPIAGGHFATAAEMGLGAGGTMRQKVYPDPHGIDTWDELRFGRVYVHIVNSQLYAQITGRIPPQSPVSARTYTEHGYPWFDLYDEHLGDVEPSPVFEDVKTIAELDAEKGFEGQQDDSSFDMPPSQVVTHGSKTAVRDGEWDDGAA
jgi:hypothetical protein